MRPYYKILKVNETATQEEIKKAYRTLSKSTHSDVNNAEDADEKQAELNIAYSVLSDPERESFTMNMVLNHLKIPLKVKYLVKQKSYFRGFWIKRMSVELIKELKK